MTEVDVRDGLAAGTVLHRQLARRAWTADPVVRLFFYPDDDALVVELIDGPPVTEEMFYGGALLVTFDGRDAQALPTSLVLTGFRGGHDPEAVAEVRDLLGPEVWPVALLLDGDRPEVEVALDATAATGRLAAWALAAKHLLPSRALGFELRPGKLRAVLVDSDGNRLGQHEMVLTDMNPVSVVRATGALASTIRTRYTKELGQRRFVVGFQLGGPVRTAEGVVEYYHKPIRPNGDELPWPPDVPLAELLATELGVPVHVFNDVHAFAALERWYGGHESRSRYVVLVVRRGIGGVLVRNGRVDNELVMEVGNLALDLAATGAHAGSVEANGAESAMVRQACLLTDRRVVTVEDAAGLADEPLVGEKAAYAFLDAGRAMARAVAAMQAVIRPHRYVLYVAEALADEQRMAARAYRTGVDHAERLVTYDPLRKPEIVVRSITRDKGARGAALIALEREGIGRPAAVRTS